MALETAADGRGIGIPATLGYGAARPARLTLSAIAAGRLPARLADSVLHQLEVGRGFLWLPVFYAVGILAYFAMPAEPALALLAAAASALSLAAALASARPLVQVAAIALAATAFGATGAKLRTDWVAAPILKAERTLTVSGWVAERERQGASGARLTIAVKAMGDLPAAETPRYVRLSVRSGAEAIAYGDGISALARIGPPRGPTFPGGYDFARADYYREVGGTGFALGAAKPVDLGPPPAAIQFFAPLERLRTAIAERIRQALDGEHGAVAEALIVGEQGGISEATQNKYRASGLAHILSISGLHMALVAGTTFFFLRAALALFPLLALTRPIKKWAAAAALLVATLYLGISGAAVPTVRSYVMLAIMLLAVMLDRRAATVRNVALAALAILIVEPESLLTASFQMSFAATLAIIAGYEAVSERRTRNPAPRRGLRGRLGGAAAGLAATSLLAGLATTPFVAFHFQRLAPLSLLANVAAGPAVSLVVMPMALLAVLLMPFGLEAWPLWAMARGLDVVSAVNDWAAARSAGLGEVPMMPAAAFLAAVAGLVWLCLWHGRWRLLGIAPMLAAIGIAFLSPRPEILVDAEGAAVAVRGSDGAYRILGGKGASFAISQWLRADGDLRPAADPGLADDTDCDRLGCTAIIAGSTQRLALTLDRRGFAEDCRLAAVVVTPLVAPGRCPGGALVIDDHALAARGAHALWYAPSGGGLPAGAFRVETAYPVERRPFMPPSNKAPAGRPPQ